MLYVVYLCYIKNINIMKYWISYYSHNPRLSLSTVVEINGITPLVGDVLTIHISKFNQVAKKIREGYNIQLDLVVVKRKIYNIDLIGHPSGCHLELEYNGIDKFKSKTQ